MLASGTHHTTCEQQRMARLISMVVWQGMWIPKCDPIDGSFMPEQCDNMNQCFCVDKETGTVDESTKMLGHVDCSSSSSSSDEVKVVEREEQTAIETTTRAQTKCEQMRAIRMISFVIWKGMWTPNCDAEGKFLPEQCDNTLIEEHCFCVDAITGEVDESTKMLGHVDCIASTSNDAPVSKIAVETKRSATLCQKMKSERMTSPTIWKGMWFPNFI
ncbi:hypothetical protein KUTeg_022737 [Tegillarca granosa]|uniref:Thyroglobulin type-1 domain-containing protein n=1 Tax=Tegillarca granosa TaxID=220873 RepID=A0ABQ9E555_TEGGR|nr:hypothetical protein KUTeg_022737 [Tegillarca granosa]